MSRTIRTFGLWSINSRKGARDKRVFSETRNGDWPVSLFQRKIGVRLFPASVYRRSFARIGEWKGFFMTHAAGAAQKRLLPFIRKVRRDLGAPTARFKLIAGAGAALTSAPGPRGTLVAAPQVLAQAALRPAYCAHLRQGVAQR